jgi:hypothetical protein
VQGNSDYYWRVNAPARVVGAVVRGIPENDAEDVLLRPNTSGSLPWVLTEDGAEYPLHSGVAVWTRPDPPRCVHAEALRQQGYRQVGEIDDNYIADPHLNVFLKSSYEGEGQRRVGVKALAGMDAMIFTNGRLRDVYWRAFKEYGLPLPELHVCGNHIFLEDRPERVESDRIRVGWMGSASHVWDVNIAWGAMMVASRMGCETVMIGYDPANPETTVSSDLAVENRSQWRKVGHLHVPWVQMNGTERMRLPLDIGLCPLRWDDFTACKSDIKALEYTLSGAAVIASNNPVYNKDWVHGETALLVGSEREMADAVELLVRDHKLRERLVTNAQQYVRESRDITKRKHEWDSAVFG